MNELMTHEQEFRRFLVFGIMVSLSLGCTRTEPTSATIEPQGRVETNSVLVTIVDRAEFDAALVRFKGQVVLVDCWATWCLPCLEQLPHSMELAAQHADDGFTVVSLSFDDPSKSATVSRILESKNGSVGTHFISEHGGGSQSMEEFEITGGALPHYKLFDRAGKLRRTFALDPTAEQQFSTADIDAAVADLLREAG